MQSKLLKGINLSYSRNEGIKKQKTKTIELDIVKKIRQANMKNVMAQSTKVQMAVLKQQTSTKPHFMKLKERA